MSDFHSAVARDAVAFEAAAALHDIQAAAAERGQEISFQAPEESGVQRSRYNSIKARDLTPLVTMFANSVEYSPSRYTLEKLGFRDDTAVIVFTPRQSWLDAGMDISDIDAIRWRMIIDGREFELTDWRRHDPLGAEYLYIVIGGKDTA